MVESTNISERTLVVFDFNKLNIKIYGTEDEPLFRCSDILIHVLEYK